MNSLLCRWLAFPFWLRALLLIASLGVAMLTVRQLWQRPLQQQSRQLAQQQQHEKQRNRTLLRHLRQRSSLREIAADIAGLEQALRPRTTQPFSLLQLTDAAGGQLQDWQPMAQGGELTLLLDWTQLQSLFRYLSERWPPVRLPQFTLKRVGDRLLLKLVVQYER